MKIEVMKREYPYFQVKLTYNSLEKLFGYETKIVKYKELPDVHYELTNGRVYIDKDGDKLGAFSNIGHEIDRFKRKLEF